jgi:fructokinase
MTILSIGEVLWDLFPAGAHLGGAPFNFAANCARLGHEALFLTAVGDDAWGTRALPLIAESGVSTALVQRTSQAATGTVQVEFDADGQPDYTILRPAAYDYLRADAETIANIAGRDPGLIYFGTLSQNYANNRQVLRGILEALPGSVKFYDVNLRRDSFSPELLRQLMPAADMAKFNEAETVTIQEIFGTDEKPLERFCRVYSARYGWSGVCVTRGPEGCSILLNGEFVEVPGFPVKIAHPVGAGDAFAAAFCHGVSRKWPAHQIGDFANRVGAAVASTPEAVSNWTMEDCYALTREEEPARGWQDR